MDVLWSTSRRMGARMLVLSSVIILVPTFCVRKIYDEVLNPETAGAIGHASFCPGGRVFYDHLFRLLVGDTTNARSRVRSFLVRAGD
jgi:hypothetical protein